MKKKWNKPAQFKRALAILFTAVLIFQAVPMQSAISMTANAEETTEGTQEDKKENSQNSGEENSKEKSNSGEDKKESDQQDTSKEGNSDSSKDGDSSSGKENTGDNTSGDSKDGENSSGNNSSDSTEDSSNTNTSEGEDKKDGENAGGSNSGQEGTAGGSGDSTGSDGTSGDTTGNGGDTGESGNTDTSGNGGSNDSSGKTGTGTDGQTPSGDNGNMNTDGSTTGDKQDEQNPSDEETKEVTISYKGCRLDGSGDYTNKKEIHSNKSSVEFKFEVGGPEDTALQYQLVSDGDEKKDDGWKAADDNNETFTISSSESYDTPKSLYVRAYSKTLDKRKEYDNDGKAISLDFDLAEPELKVVKVDPETTDESIVTRENVTYTVSATDNKDYTVYKCALSSNAEEPSNDVSNELWKKAGTKADADADNNIEVTFDEEGNYNVYFIAVDEAGNTSEIVKAQSHLIDKTEPAVTLTAPTEASNNFKVTIKAEDQVSNDFASGLKEDFSYVLKQGEEKLKEGNGKLTIKDGKGTETISFDDLEADGKYKLTVTVNDLVGNPGEGYVELDFDQNKPDVTISIDQSDTRKDDNGIFHYRTQDLKDNSSTITFEKSKGNGVLTKVSVMLIPDESISDTTTYTYKPDIKEEENKKITVPLADVIGETNKIGDGTWTIYAYAEDSAGNSVGNEAGAGDGAKELATVIVDDTAPVPALGEPVVVDEKTETVTKDEKTYFNGAVTVTATTDSSKEANGEKLVWTIGDSGNSTDGTKTFSPSGENVAEALPETVFMARDLAGNEGSVTFQKSEDEKYYFDLLAPVITYTVAGTDNLTIVGDKDTFEYKITINDETISCGIDPASIQYAIINSDDPNAKPADKDWIKNAGVTEKESGIYTFSITSPGKGVVYIRAFDKLKNEAKTVKANVLVMEKVEPIITSVTVTTQKANLEKVTKTYDNPTGSIKVEEMPVNALEISVTAEDKPDDTYSGLKSITYTLTGTKSDGTPYVSVKPKELSKKTPLKLSDLEKTKTTDAVDVKDLFGITDELSGTFTLSISVTDNCGNTSNVQTIELELDNTLPVISVDISPSKLVKFPTYHNAENSEVIVEIKEKNISSYKISVGDVTVENDKDYEGVTKKTNGDVMTVTFSSDAVKKGNSEGEIVVTAEVKDKANNSTKTFSNSDAWVYLLKKSDEKASFILDITAPIATIQYATDGTNKSYAYDEQLVSGGPGLSAYYSGDITPSITVEETNEIEGALTANSYGAADLSSFPTSGTALTFTEDTSTKGIWNATIKTLTGDSYYAYYTLQGTDRAGNALIVNESFEKDDDPAEGTGETISEKKVENKDTNGTAYTSMYLLVIDKKAPIATILYTTDGTNKPYAYNEQLVSGGPGLSAYYSGDITPSITVEESNKIDKQSLTANSYGAADLSIVPTSETSLAFTEDTSKKGIWNATIKTLTGDSYYAYYTLQGTDRAGNALVVNETFADADPESGKKENISEKKVKNKDTNGKLYTSLYFLVIDKKAPIATILYTPHGTNTPYVYNEALVQDGPNLSVYYSGDITPSITVEETNEIEGALTANSYGAADLSSVPTSETSLAFREDTGTKGSWDATKLTGDSYYAYYTLQGTDRAGNKLKVNESFAQGKTPVDSKDKHIPAFNTQETDKQNLYKSKYLLVIDKINPAVTEIVTNNLELNDKKEVVVGAVSNPSYYKDDDTIYFNSNKGIQTSYTIREQNAGAERLESSYTIDGANKKPSASSAKDKDGFKYTIPFTKDGKYTNIKLSGTDRAGNEIVYDSKLVPCKSNANTHNENEIKDTSSKVEKSGDLSIRIENQGNGVILAHPRILDRESPVATIEHVIPDNTTGYLYPEKENGSTATMYSNHAVTTKTTVSDKDKNGKPINLYSNNMNISKTFHKAGGKNEISAIELEQSQQTSNDTSTLIWKDVVTTQEGHYTFSISGTDRAGNPVVVTEKLVTNKDKNAVAENKGGFGGDTPSEKAASPYSSFYALVYDCTAPVYRLTINNPSNLEETFDEKTSIAYYGKSVSAINAKYVVTDYNFDDTRIQAGITSESASGVNNMDSLSPSWTTPDIKASTKEDNGLTAATFNLTVSVDGQHEGIHRLEIGGCDKAGNFLVQSSEQVTVDNSTKRADLAAKTVAQDASEGKFWTQRKAVDVSAPTGALKVRSSKDSNNYYHYKFDPGQNTPVMYEPFRKETSAYVIVESDDCSPTIVQYNLRSQDGSKDTEYKKKNPLVSAGNNGYKNDNTRDVTVNGEQAFYLENIIIKDRAGNVRANDSKSKYTMARSNNVYLDVTTPVVSDIKDAESPQVKIVASNSFTRHEADGERYIYKPDGSALDLKVSINDPGGKERSSGLQKVEVEVKVGGKVVTEKVSLGKIPYTYKKGSSDSHAPLVYDINDASISIPTGSFAESNDITITVTAWDNSGNKSTPSKDGGLLNLGIDTTAPTAIVTYHDTAQPQHDKYFKADRVVEVAIFDRNVDNGKINIDTNTSVPGSFTAPHENKTTDGGDDGNKDKWTKTLHYDVDGDYTLQLSGTDALGNKLTDIKWDGPAPNEFTVDKTQPVIRINLPAEVNSQDGIKYYDNAATASIEIQEHNFFEETDPSLLNVTIEPTNHSGAEAPANPGRSSFSNSGADMHVSTVNCREDGDYEVTASYTDMAGNPAVVQGGEGKKSDQEAWSGKFVVDTVVPTLKMDPETFNVDKATGNPLKDPADQIYTRKDFAPRVIINDINYDEVNSKFDVKAYGANVRNEDLTEKAGDVSKGEYNIQFKNFEMVRDMDGVYKVTAIATDLAKHQAKLDFLFSVNRFGSTYVYADEATESKVTGYYINDTREPLRILELSPVELKTHTAELFKDHNRNTLAEDTQYTFNPAKGSTSIGTNSEGHRVYEYTISPEVFEEEGVYDFILSSTDAAGNENSTTMFRDGSVKDSEIEQVRFPIEFQVDKTVPVNRLTGVENDKEQFNTDQLEIMVYPEDYQTDIKDVEIKIWDGNRNGTNAIEDKAKYLHYRNIGEEEDVQKLAQENVYPIQDAKAGIPVTLEDKGSWQLLEVITTDLAGNKSTDYRTEDLEVNIMESRRPFLVTTNPIIQFYNFKPALYGTIGGVALLLFLLFFWKRRKEEKTGGKAA